MDVLIVDDSMLANHAIKSYFSKLGHNIVGVARDGKEGEKMFSEMQPDIVTIDAIMPGDISGADFVKFVNSSDSETGRNTKILFISSEVIPNEIKSQIKVDSYIVKPVTLANIENAMVKM